MRVVRRVINNYWKGSTKSWWAKGFVKYTSYKPKSSIVGRVRSSLSPFEDRMRQPSEVRFSVMSQRKDFVTGHRVRRVTLGLWSGRKTVERRWNLFTYLVSLISEERTRLYHDERWAIERILGVEEWQNNIKNKLSSNINVEWRPLRYILWSMRTLHG